MREAKPASDMTGQQRRTTTDNELFIAGRFCVRGEDALRAIARNTSFKAFVNERTFGLVMSDSFPPTSISVDDIKEPSTTQ
jgi:hypothetical protein